MGLYSSVTRHDQDKEGLEVGVVGEKRLFYLLCINKPMLYIFSTRWVHVTVLISKVNLSIDTKCSPKWESYFAVDLALFYGNSS